jgi:hypothetical protein
LRDGVCLMMTAPALVLDLLELLHAEWIKCAEFLELLGHLEGCKPVVRLVADSERCDVLLSFLAKAALHHRVSEFCLRTEFSTGLGDTFQRIDPSRNLDGDCVIFVGAPGATAEAHAMELDGADAVSCGMVYGYPACCATSYSAVQDGTPWVIPFLRDVTRTSHHGWRSNKLASLFPPHLTIIPDFFPCSIHCPSTAALAGQYEQLLIDAGLAELRELIATELQRPLLIHDGWVYRFEVLEKPSTRPFSHVGRTSFLPLESKPRQAPLCIQGLSFAREEVELVVSTSAGSRDAVATDGPLLLFAS